MSMLIVDGVTVKSPSTMEWGLNDISASDAGRTQDTIMHKNRKGQKRTIKLVWNGLTQEEMHPILVAFNPEYINVTYYDPLDGQDVERTFYSGDKTAPVHIWTIDNKRYTSLTFNVIER